MADSIILIGMPAIGKTTIAGLLSQKLTDYICIDTDILIEKNAGMSISDIFKNYSEEYFRKLEYDAIKLACTGSKKIISVGGGAFENPDSRCRLLNFGKVFYLKSDLDVLYYRIAKDNSRPLLQSENPQKALLELLSKREENYLKAHVTVDTSNLSSDEIIKVILGNL